MKRIRDSKIKQIHIIAHSNGLPYYLCSMYINAVCIAIAFLAHYAAAVIVVVFYFTYSVWIVDSTVYYAIE